MHFDATPRCLDQHVAQFVADLVLEQDEGLDQHFALRLPNRVEHGGKELLAVDEQAQAVAAFPGRFHRLISAARGAWSDRWDQGRRGNTIGECTCALRT